MTKKQKRFVEEYLIDLNATQAAIRAGYKPDSAYAVGSENLRKPEIKAAVDRAMAERSKRTGINQDRILQELARIGFVRITDIVDQKTGEIKEGVSDDDLACIQSIKVKPGEFGTERETKLYDKKSVLIELGKHLGMFTGNAGTGQDEGVVIVNDAPEDSQDI